MEPVVFQLPFGRKRFRSRVLKPASDSKFESSTNLNPHPEQMIKIVTNYDIEADIWLSKEVKPNKEHTFIESRKKELDGLLKRVIFGVVDIEAVPKGTRI